MIEKSKKNLIFLPHVNKFFLNWIVLKILIVDYFCMMYLTHLYKSTK